MTSIVLIISGAAVFALILATGVQCNPVASDKSRRDPTR